MKVLFTTVLIIACNVLFAQEEKYALGLDIGIGATSSADLMLSRNFYLGAKKKIIIGPALRLTYASAGALDYISAPATITISPEKIDTVSFGNTATLSTNLAINLGYQFNSKLSFLFNIDVFGASIGKQQSGVFRPGTASQLALKTPSANNLAKPTSPNILLVGDRDFGTLNSSFTANYRLKTNLALKLGAGFLFTEYKTENQLGANNVDRFRYKAIQGVLGVAYYF